MIAIATQRRIVIVGALIIAAMAFVDAAKLLPRVVATMFFPPLPAEVAYPKAPPMPAPVPQTVEELIGGFEQILREKAPELLASLQPGLTDTRIEKLGKKHQFILPHDLRALYRWRNGAPHRIHPDVFAGHHFVPLEQAIAAREAFRRQVAAMPEVQRHHCQALLGHCDAWLPVIPDHAGDGYYYDPGRSEAEGSFFYNFKEDGTYVFFPAFRNFLAGTLAGHESGVFRFGDHGAVTADDARACKLWKRYGAENPRGD